MKRALACIVATGCYTGSASPPPSAPSPAPARSPEQREVLDEGRFQALKRATVEEFSIERTAEGWRFAVKLTDPSTTLVGDMITDLEFRPVHGELLQSGELVSTPVTLRLRTENGLLVSEAQVQGKPPEQVKRATQRADWYIGGAVNAFLTPVCQDKGGAGQRSVFPDTTVEISAAQPLEGAGVRRGVVVRHVVYPNKHDVVVACEGGKVMGNRDARGSIVIRAGEDAVGRALAELP